jgi:hypothetical protein
VPIIRFQTIRVLLNLLWPGITTWQMHEIVSWEQHKHYLKYGPETTYSNTASKYMQLLLQRQLFEECKTKKPCKNFHLAFSLTVIANEPLELGTENSEWGH